MQADALGLFRCLQCHACLRMLPAGACPAAPVAALGCVDCSASYPVVDDIPRFAGGANYAESFGLQWNLHRRTQLDSHTGLSLSRDRLFGVTQWPASLRGQRVLEAGCGAGRFTEVLLGTGAEIYSFDYSAAVDANRANHARAPNLHLFQADIFAIPLAPRAFDKVLCLGVLQHTPDPGRAFASLESQVRPGGELIIDVYSRRLRSLASWKYLLRPLTKRLDKERLYRAVEGCVRLMLPLATLLRRVAGRAGGRLLPIVEYSALGLPPELNLQWAVLDTFDMYSPAHDHPQSLATVERWFREAGYSDFTVGYGPNGVVGRGRRPA